MYVQVRTGFNPLVNRVLNYDLTFVDKDCKKKKKKSKKCLLDCLRPVKLVERVFYFEDGSSDSSSEECPIDHGPHHPVKPVQPELPNLSASMVTPYLNIPVLRKEKGEPELPLLGGGKVTMGPFIPLATPAMDIAFLKSGVPKDERVHVGTFAAMVTPAMNIPFLRSGMFRAGKSFRQARKR